MAANIMRFGRGFMSVGFLLAFAAPAPAQYALKAGGVVNVRSGPGTGYGILGTASAGQVYVGIEKSGDWWKIYWDGRTAYTYASYYSGLSGTTGVKVTASSLNVRSGPGTGYAILGRVYAGQIHFWTQNEGLGGWYKIWWGGRAAYVYGSYVTRVNLAYWSGGSSSSSSSSTTSSGTPTYLNATHYYQVNGYYCGPTTVQITAKYLTGVTYSQYTIAATMGTDGNGTSVWPLGSGLKAYASSSYWIASSFNRDAVVANISRYKPVPINFQTYYIGFWYGRWVGHYSPIIGYTSGGYYIHDTTKGPGLWASSTEVWNAVHYHTGYYYRVY